MRMGNFSGSLLFGAVAALGSVAFMVAMRSLLGASLALSTYCVASAVLYLVAMAPNWSRGIRIGFLAAVLGGATLVFAPSATVAVLGATVVLGLMRSGFLFRARPGRALTVELSLLGGGLLLANALAGAGSLGLAMAIWGFFLVQSVYFLLGGINERSESTPEIDPFEEACVRATRLMEEWQV
jgi:hypothetical protein